MGKGYTEDSKEDAVRLVLPSEARRAIEHAMQ
jgi:hypothetical protein